ncbi:hypothetical protein K8I85_11715 [bacterium]|nr:hypothetical protein [bacterium]
MAAMGALGVLALAATASAGPDSRKQDRQIDLFERIVDDMLVESPNWLVRDSHEARGRYRSGQGARFTFDARLVHRGWSGGWDNHWGGKWWKNILVKGDDDVIVIDRDDWEDMDDEDLSELRKESRDSRKKYRDRSLKRQERLYERGKAELIETLADFGDVLTTLPDGESVELVVYLGDAELFDERDLRELSVSAKMSDIRAFASGSIDDKKFTERVKVVEE